MSVILFTWNPNKWDISERTWAREIRQIEDCGFLYSRWSCGNSKFIRPGDTAFLLRQGRERGLVSKGTVISEAFQESDWDDESEIDASANYVEISWTTRLPIEKRLTIEILKKELPDIHWTPFSSGTQVQPESHSKLFEIWEKAVADSGVKVHHAQENPVLQPSSDICSVCGLDPQVTYSVQSNRILLDTTLADGIITTVCPSCSKFARTTASLKSANDLREMLGSHH